MNTFARATATSLLAASLLLALGACKKIDPDAPRPAKAGATPSSLEIKGLPTEEEQAGYAIGLQIGSTLAEIKDDVDFDAIVKAMRTSMNGETPLMDEAQARQAFEAFGQRMEAMATEMQTAAAQADKAQAKTDLDAIQARYQPDVDAFATEFQTFATARTAASGQDASAQIATAAQQIKGIPAMARAQIEAAANAPAAAPETPAQPQ